MVIPAVGAAIANPIVDVPIVVLPLNVVSVNVKLADFALAVFIALLSPVGIERDVVTDVPLAICTPLANV